MPSTINDVGERPGKPPLTDAEKQAIADEWNANEIANAPPAVGDIEITDMDELEIIRMRAATRPTPAEIRAQQQRKRDRGEA